MKFNTSSVRRTVFAAICLALCMVLPFLTGQIPEIGAMLCPMHLPVLLCGLLCGWQFGLGVGFIAPLLRSAIFGMPVLWPGAVAMAFELAAYGLLSGIFYRLFPKKFYGLLCSLVCAMIGGRLVWGLAMVTIAGIRHSNFTLAAFWAGAVANALPGILLQLVLIPAVVLALKKAGLTPDKR